MCLKVPHYTVFHQFHTAVRSPTTYILFIVVAAVYCLFFDMHCPKFICGPELQLSKSRSTELYSEQSVSVPAPLNANELRLSTPTWRALPATSLSGRGSPLR